jgi:hypothetical protein
MDFRKATDILCGAVTHAELADALGVSLASVRQARLDPSAAAHRSPPQGWEAVAAKLARKRGEALLRLANQLGGDA